MKKSTREKAKKMALKDYKKKTKDMMGEESSKMMPMKVSVASDSPEGLKKGLSKAEEILEKRMGMVTGDGDEAVKEHEEEVKESMMGMYDNDMSPEEVAKKKSKK